MLKSLYVCATTAALALSASNGHAMSINIGAGVKPALDATDVIQKAAVYVVDGRPYCFYFDGWHGAGWYRCGFAHRRNLGWGGVYGWQGWSYGPAEKRYGHRGTTVREGTTVRSRSYGQRGTTTVREGTTVRSRSTVRERTEGSSRNAGSNTTIRRSTTGSGSQGGGEIKGGAAPTGGRNVQGGAQGGTKAHDGGGKAEGGGQGGKGGGGEKQ
jgi:hypothetical protein